MKEIEFDAGIVQALVGHDSTYAMDPIRVYIDREAEDLVCVHVEPLEEDRALLERLTEFPERYAEIPVPDHGCWENLQAVLDDYGYKEAPEDIPSPLNLFQSIDIGPDGRMIWHFQEVEPPEKRFPNGPAHIDLVAVMNILFDVSACPERGRGKPVKVQVFDK